jgi:hypothetical protein
MFFTSYRLRRIRRNACDRVSSIAVTTGIRYSFNRLERSATQDGKRFTALVGAVSIARRVGAPIVRSRRPGTLALDNAAIYDSLFPDINVWVALTYEGHSHHSDAAQWFATLPPDARFAFCL